jgi:hypothetical protein
MGEGWPHIVAAFVRLREEMSRKEAVTLRSFVHCCTGAVSCKFIECLFMETYRRYPDELKDIEPN